ncbi:hypothetical protein JNW88_24675 [Micromonospora sp. ATA32]|nr:hypothetical protein [Micromonospora sp. ATA32]
MVRYKYSPEVLAKAAAEAHSIAEVMRLLGIRLSGGSHAHIGSLQTSCDQPPTVLLILKAAGLTTAAARHSRLGESAGVA